MTELNRHRWVNIGYQLAALANMLVSGPVLAQWVVIHGDHGFVSHNIPPEAETELRSQNKSGGKLKSIGFATTNGWVVFAGINRVQAHQIPVEAIQTIAEVQKSGGEFRSIAFTAQGGWVIFTSKGIQAQRIDEEASQKLEELGKEHLVKSIAFTPAGGWVILLDRNDQFAKNIPNDALKQLNELKKQNTEIKNIAFSPNGGWVILYDHHRYSAQGVSKDLIQALNRLASKGVEMRSVTFTQASVIPFKADPEKAKQEVMARMEHHKVPGLCIALISDGKIGWVQSYGVLRAGQSAAVTNQTNFQAASLSNPVTAVAALRLVHSGMLNLDEDLNAKLKSWKVPDNEFTHQKKPTLRRVLSHSAGFNVQSVAGYSPGSMVPTLTQVLDGQPPSNNPPVRVEYLPGSKSQYSVGGYCVLQQLIVDTTGKLFPEILQEQLLEPVGMKNSTFAPTLPDEWRPNVAEAHNGNGDPFHKHWNTYEPTLAAAGLWSTAEDLGHFVAALIQAYRGSANSILPAVQIKEMLKRQVADAGLGLFLSGNGRSLAFSHNGMNAGYRCYLIGYPATGHGAVLMTNSENGDKLHQELVESLRIEYGWLK